MCDDEKNLIQVPAYVGRESTQRLYPLLKIMKSSSGFLKPCPHIFMMERPNMMDYSMRFGAFVTSRGVRAPGEEPQDSRREKRCNCATGRLKRLSRWSHDAFGHMTFKFPMRVQASSCTSPLESTEPAVHEVCLRETNGSPFPCQTG